ncbi:MAG: bifunctional 5,10-methylenetetrahydrofolate dehydrogenase/5,10-methenyltetrahydrofolate cyclohydrolase [bacterium]
MQKISGTKIAQKIIEKLKQQSLPSKAFVAILVGSDPVSRSFLKKKERIADELGVQFELYEFPETFSSDALRRSVSDIARQKRVGGVMIQLPMPHHIQKHYVLNAIPREKDVEVLGERSLGAFYNNRNSITPPAVSVVKSILQYNNYDLTDKKVAIVGLGSLVGKPLAVWCMGQAQTMFLLDKGSDYSALKEADIIITGTGDAGIITSSMLKKDAFVIDFGYSIKEKDGKKILQGDFVPARTDDGVFYTPTPNGTGPILVASLFENFFILN